MSGPRLVLVPQLVLVPSAYAAQVADEPDPVAYLAGCRAAELALTDGSVGVGLLIAEAEFVIASLAEAGDDAPRTRGYRDTLVKHRDAPA